MKVDKELYMECIHKAYSEKMLKKPLELRLYTNAIYDALLWGRKIDKENEEYHRKQKYLDRCF